MPFAVVWIVLIIVGGIVTTSAILKGSNVKINPALTTPEQALKLRFARGEIDEAEYFRSLAILEHDRLLELDD